MLIKKLEKLKKIRKKLEKGKSDNRLVICGDTTPNIIKDTKPDIKKDAKPDIKKDTQPDIKIGKKKTSLEVFEVVKFKFKNKSDWGKKMIT